MAFQRAAVWLGMLRGDILFENSFLFRRCVSGEKRHYFKYFTICSTDYIVTVMSGQSSNMFEAKCIP